MIPYIIIVAIALFVLYKGVSLYRSNNKYRHYKQVSKRIYNYAGKTQAQIHSILALELQQLPLGTAYDLVEFSKPIFYKDGSAEYIMYLQPKTKNERNII